MMQRSKILNKKDKDFQKPLKRIGRILELPQEFLEGAAHIEMAGNREIIIEGCQGIIDYNEETIKLSAGKYAILLTGQNLEIKSLLDENIIIDGTIFSLEFKY